MITDDERIRVLFTITSTTVGGSEKMLLERSLRMDRRRFALHFCSLREKGQIALRLEDAGWPVTTLSMGERCGPIAFARACLALAAQIGAVRADIVHSFLHRANVLSRLAALLVRDRPAVVSTEASLALGRSALIPLGRSLTWRLADQIVVNADAVKRRLVERGQVAAERIKVIHYGIDPARFRPRSGWPPSNPHFPDPDAVVAATVSRLSPEKGLHHLLRALASLAGSHPHLRLLICGHGPEEPVLRRLCDRLGIADRVRFTGFLSPFGDDDEVARLLSAIDIFCLPSVEEGLPGVVLEAMGAGCPVIASAVGGVPELVDDEETGLLVPPGDPAALATALSRLADDGERRARMGARGRRLVEERFNINRTVTEMSRLYETLASQRVPRRRVRSYQDQREGPVPTRGRLG